jgi:hypothetical protein
MFVLAAVSVVFWLLGLVPGDSRTREWHQIMIRWVSRLVVDSLSLLTPVYLVQIGPAKSMGVFGRCSSSGRRSVS